MPVKHFFDIPVYRLPSEKYYREREAYVEQTLFPNDFPDSDQLRAQDKADPSKNAFMRDYLEKKFGGCWRFNEIIGYIRLHFLGSQIRGEYYGVAKKRIVRTRTRTLEYLTWKLAPEVGVPHPVTQDGILGAIWEYIEDCRKELRGRHIDTSMFEFLAPHIDWVSVYAERTKP